MKKILKSAMLVALTAAGFTACSDEYDPGLVNREQISFAKHFEDVFGKVDPNQDWNTVEKNQVTVSTPSSSNVKIYAKIGAQYQLVADYLDVTGTKTLNFDAIDGTREVMVSDGRNAKVVEVGGKVDFGASTRTINVTPDGTSVYGVTISETSDYMYFTSDLSIAYRTLCPEGTDNRAKITSNFTLVSNGQFTIYPVYYQTGSWSNVGLYYRDRNDEIHMIEFYQMKHGDDFQYYNTTNGWTSFALLNQDSGDKSVLGLGQDDNEMNYRSKGITINLPAGTVFGLYMYVHNNNGAEFADGKGWYNYSETSLNTSDRCQGASKVQNVDRENEPMAGFYTVGNRTFFSFEDWNGDSDLNDMVFMFDGENIPTPVDDNATEWLVACEDLDVTGSFDDEDFNDVIFKVSHGAHGSNGYTTISVTPLAAVGTYESELYFQESGKSEPTRLGEIHELVNPSVQPVSTHLYDVINGQTVGNAGASITLQCSSDFSMDSYTPGGGYHSGSSAYKQTLMGGFSIKSYRSATDEGEYAINIAPNEQRGKAGAMFCIPASWLDEHNVRHTWAWPKETTNIATAYPDFANWVSDMDNYTGWYKQTPESEDFVVSGTYSVSESAGTGTSGNLNDQVFQQLSASVSNVLLSTLAEENNTSIEVTLLSGSTGDITVTGGNNDIFTYTLTGRVITINAVSKGTGSISIVQSADATYPQQTLSIPVTVISAKNPHLQSAASVSYTAEQKTKVFEYTSMSNQSVTVSSSNTGVVTVACTQPTDNGDGTYKGTITLTTVGQGDAKITLNQSEGWGSDVEFGSGSCTVNVTVGAPDYGTEINKSNIINNIYGSARVAVEVIESALPGLTDGDKILVTFMLKSSSNIAGISVSNDENGNPSTSIVGSDYSNVSKYTREISYSSIKDYIYMFINAYGTEVTTLYVKKI